MFAVERDDIRSAKRRHPFVARKPTDRVRTQREIGEEMIVGVRQVQRYKAEGRLNFGPDPDGTFVVQSLSARSADIDAETKEKCAEARTPIRLKTTGEGQHRC
jgi:hypothetical protein